MKRQPFKVFISILMMAVALILALTSCETKEENPEEAPILPPESTFTMSFEGFTKQDSAELKSLNTEMPTYQNWGRSFVEVNVWNLVVNLVMVRPVLSFVEAFKHEAIYHPNEKYWTWTYNFNHFGVRKAELRGYYENDSVIWEMRIDDYMAYEGKSHKSGTGGYWYLKRELNNNDYWLQIDWARENDSIGELKYTNILEGDAGYGGYIHYGATDEALNRFYHIYNKVNENLVQIEWNSVTREGRTSNPLFYGNENWQCWNSIRQDIVCE